MVGSTGTRATQLVEPIIQMRITAQYADIWNGFGLPDVARHKCQVLDEHCRRLGRDPGEIERSIGGFNAERITLSTITWRPASPTSSWAWAARTGTSASSPS